MIVGYARTSTLVQTAGLEAQERDLAAAGCEKVFVEQVSSVDVTAREKLLEALEYVREGGYPSRDQVGPPSALCGAPAGNPRHTHHQRRKPSHPVYGHRHGDRYGQADVDPSRGRGRV